MSVSMISSVGRGTDIQDIEGLIHRIPICWDDLKTKERTTKSTEGGDLVSGIYYNLDALEKFNDGGWLSIGAGFRSGFDG